MNIDDLIKKLKQFPANAISLGESITDNRIKMFEEKYDLILPIKFKEFMAKCNGLSLRGNLLLSFNNEDYGIEKAYYIEHFQVEFEMPTNLIPITPDGEGNHYCLDISSGDENECNVVFWQFGYEYSENDQPEITDASFLSFVDREFIQWFDKN